MDATARQQSIAIDQVARALAEMTVSRHAEIDSTLGARYGSSWREDWSSDVRARIEILSQSIAVRRPELFVESALWSWTAFQAREVQPADLEMSLNALRETLDEKLPPVISKPASEYVARAIEEVSKFRENGSIPWQKDDELGRLASQYLEALLEGRGETGQRIILDAAEAGTPVIDLYEQALIPSQIAIGRMWHLREITVADEHFATANTLMVMSRLRAYFPKPTKGSRMLGATVPGELHELGARVVTDFFALAGWETMYLGPNLPTRDLISILKSRQVDLIAVSCGTARTLRAVGDLVDEIRADDELAHLKILAGGQPFNLAEDLWREIGADGFAPTAREAVALGDSLVNTAQ
ncbi:MAG: B12-binding domain-containing protein [Phycisphaerales bacterium]